MKNTIVRRLYDFVAGQHQINHVGEILQALADQGFTLVYYGRPRSNNELYPNVEFIAQKAGEWPEKEMKKFLELEENPWRYGRDDSDE